MMSSPAGSDLTSGPSALQVEHLDRPLGCCVRVPRLSWWLPLGSSTQFAYPLCSDKGWDTGRVASDQSLLVPYGGSSLTSQQPVTWKVKICTDLAESEWAESWFEVGLLAVEDWSARWIEPLERPRAGRRTH